ncbi:sigma-70 family RNA polymerase sigma factor [Acinetobacter higginsii]|uniref:sigma-70 family RNA polymerase sigma factor n=1 Tax=Acinetobacter higginsii TaxID=70347 RepID=UPI001F4B647E|nr:sigma-70 family RNA polymerase sigma factor [Acinetobacter higginsii]MCH7306479.1 sigma-70 family RNA polymerase sigma factor [Acinetobacter higginsii]MCH7341688.1 sigma-70 family RNA polymerase sigma factor [Acinetobacter higginsii]MDO3663664.1 sigma-70 family RNA polymerase sigma factor [Acinetobacter higginsii]
MSDPVNTLYRQHHSWLYQWLKRRLNHSEDAADLAHDTFIRILKRKDQLYFDQPRALLTTVAKGILINWYQRKSIEKAYLEALSSRPEYDEISPEQKISAIESLCLINQLLNQMPERQQRVFIWSQLEGLTQQEIANRLNISTRTVMRDLVAVLTQCLAIMD